MNDTFFSLILLPTLRCNAACDYCFENKTDGQLSMAELDIITDRLLDYMAEKEIGHLSVYWQGGEVMTLSPTWIERACDRMREAAEKRNREIFHFLQSNMIGYDRSWNRVISAVFGNSVGTSFDIPNRHRKVNGGDTEAYDRIWRRNISEAQDSGIHIGVIAIPNPGTLALGARRFYSRFVTELGIRDFQINTPFPGGSSNAVKQGLPLDNRQLSRFMKELADLRMADTENGPPVCIAPFDGLLDYFTGEASETPCIWQDNCANDFICIDPGGNVSQCDCWAASYPAFRFGNILRERRLSHILEHSPARQQFLARPGRLIQSEDCLSCDYLALCHGGCPVRAYTTTGTLFAKDPYCETYQAIFRHMEELAARIAAKDASANSFRADGDTGPMRSA
ncbi:radical SAM protein [Desulfonema ishimotonii]|uniref:Radical SAM protein n=1 Tax=Desulfonema ishimotonii TaxID=45657 RepID=A0A401FYQ4_9BACT|nr:radical SAM protein [Desulfonema ishimotonii]GBC62080.1 radical SAM protein [Desulfonema ishimotonii]